MNNSELIGYADQRVVALLEDGDANGLSHDEVVASMTIALRLLRTTHPDPTRLFAILQEAEGMLDLLISPAGEPC
jgi:hypothetical protein